MHSPAGSRRAARSPTIFWVTPRSQYLASEEEQATYYETVLERLLETGAAGRVRVVLRRLRRSAVRSAAARHALCASERSGSCALMGARKPAADVFRRFSERRIEGPLVQGAVPASAGRQRGRILPRRRPDTSGDCTRRG